jgi:hypothetical protein
MPASTRRQRAFGEPILATLCPQTSWQRFSAYEDAAFGFAVPRTTDFWWAHQEAQPPRLLD